MWSLTQSVEEIMLKSPVSNLPLSQKNICYFYSIHYNYHCWGFNKQFFGKRDYVKIRFILQRLYSYCFRQI